MEALRRSDFDNINSVILNMPISTEAIMPYIYHVIRNNLCNYLSNIQQLYLKRLFQPDYRCILNLTSNSAGKIIIMPYWHALLALSAFGPTAPHPTWEDLRKTSTPFPLHEGMWTLTSPNHQPKASNPCSESADCGLSTEFQHYLEVSSFWDLLWGLFCFVKNISTWWGEGWGRCHLT